MRPKTEEILLGRPSIVLGSVDGKKEIPAVWVGQREATALAVLRFKAEALQPQPEVFDHEVERGEQILRHGSPHRQTLPPTAGKTR